jgi:RNA polymerase sigma-70 factor (ECF subfamily)
MAYMGEKNTTTQLIEKAQKGDREAVERLFSRVYPDLLQAARFRLGKALRARMDTLDLAQTAYFEAFRDLQAYRYRGEGSFHRWLLGILENKIRKRLKFHHAQRRDFRREVHVEGSQELPAPSTSPTRKLIANEDRERIEAAMDHLDDAHREVLIYRYYLRMSWKEVGQCLGRSEEAAQMLCHRALQNLKKLYGS